VKILVIGSGAREHAIVRSLLSDPIAESVDCAPGNAGIALEVPTHPIDVKNAAAITLLAQQLDVDLVVIGPEVPLAHGAADAVTAAGIACFGPLRDAAKLEASKSFAKEVMTAAKVPTSNSYTCSNVADVEKAMVEFGAPYVIKDDGLAAGKGVVVTSEKDVAIAHATECFANQDAKVVVEEFLDGPEVSLFLLCDGKSVLPLQPAQDFKRVGDNDAGPNTGGMGAYSPLPWAQADLSEFVVTNIGQPVIDYMQKIGKPFSGVLFVGLAITSKGPKVIEFNARFGDPETQVVLARLKTPLASVLYFAATGKLNQLPPLEWSQDAAVTVVVASENYPKTPVLGDVIAGLDRAAALPNIQVLHAGTAERAGEIITAGGRVLSVTATGPDLKTARARAYEAVGQIRIHGAHFRTDIAQKAAN
jgi:phosphoribosylamine--glycine ligase